MAFSLSSPLRRLALWLVFTGSVLATNLAEAQAQSQPPLQSLPQLLLPAPGLGAEHLAVIINTRDPLSWKIADYYQRKHHLPPRNLIHIAFDPGETVMHPGEFAVLQKVVEAKTPKTVQAYLLTWAEPYRVGCMSISSAFALGFDPKYCASGCKQTAINPYANSHSTRPFDDFGIRPTMLLAAETYAEAKALINRGVRAKEWFFHGPVKQPAAYLVETPDHVRSVRKVYFPEIKQRFADRLKIHMVTTDGIEGASDILFYFTGDRYVKGVDKNHYLPGAITDHLTSSGGQLTDSYQMSAIEWLRAGATGSYGTVVEPCAILAKFPHPGRLMSLYLQGHTLLEAYWKSVYMPGQGVFIGDPLAAPFQGYRLVQTSEYLRVHTAQLSPGNYKLLAADSDEGPFITVTSGISITEGLQTFTIDPPYHRVYKMEKLLSTQDWRLPMF